MSCQKYMSKISMIHISLSQCISDSCRLIAYNEMKLKHWNNTAVLSKTFLATKL